MTNVAKKNDTSSQSPMMPVQKTVDACKNPSKCTHKARSSCSNSKSDKTSASSSSKSRHSSREKQCEVHSKRVPSEGKTWLGFPNSLSALTLSYQSPNDYIWQKIESLIEQMVSEDIGIPVRTVKSLMSTIPSTFTGSDVIHWLIDRVGASDVSEAVNLANRISAMGYIFCIDDHVLAVKNDSHTYYRFQTPFLYPSRCLEAVDNVDYAVYLCKRTMQNKQRLELAGFEAERLASLQTLYCHKWEFVYIQAEAEAKVDKKRDKLERLVLDSQERAYWDVNKPPPGCVNTKDIDMRKLCRAKRPKKEPYRPVNFPLPSGPDGQLLLPSLDNSNCTPNELIAKLNACLRPRIKTSKASESLQNYCDQYSEFDLLLSSTPALASASTVPHSSSSGLTQSSALTTSPTSSKVHHSPSSSSSSRAVVEAGGGDNLTRQQRSISTSGLATSTASHLPPSISPMRSGSGGSAGPSGAPLIVMNNSGGGSGTCLAPSGAGVSNSVYDVSHESVSALNPWISDNPDYWATDSRPKFLPIRRIKKWSFSIFELLKDPVGLEEFQRWLEKEFSAENLHFWQACQELKGAPLREVRDRIQSIYNQYLAPNAVDSLNVDSKVAETVRRHLVEDGNDLDRYCFEEAESHIFHLMKSDSYCRFLRSDVYRELFTSGKKKSKKLKAGQLHSTGGGGATGATSLGVNLIGPTVD